MNTEKTPLSEDLLSMQESFEEMFKKSSENKHLILASHEETGKMITETQHDFLQGLGFNKVQNVEEFQTTKQELEKLGMTMETISQLEKIKRIFGKNIITYNNVCQLCEKYNLYFGSSSLFTGKIPMKNVKELEEFQFGTFSSHYCVVKGEENTSIVNGKQAMKAETMIVAPLNMFSLKGILITNSREIIKCSLSEVKPPKKECADDPIVLLPFRLNQQIYFIVVTHWDNSKSII